MSEASVRCIDVHHHLCPPDGADTCRMQKSLDDMAQAGVATAMLSITAPGFWFGDVGPGISCGCATTTPPGWSRTIPAASASSPHCRSPTSRAAYAKLNTCSTRSRPTASAFIPITRRTALLDLQQFHLCLAHCRRRSRALRLCAKRPGIGGFSPRRRARLVSYIGIRRRLERSGPELYTGCRSARLRPTCRG